MAAVPGDVVEWSYQKTRQKINVSFARLWRAFLAPSRQRSPQVRRVGWLSRRDHRMCAHYRRMCASERRYYLV